MIFAIALLASATSTAETAPTNGRPLGSPASWVRATDFPASEWKKATVTKYELMVDAAGHPVNCIITGPSGSNIIDEVVCSSLMKRAKFSPAKDTQGNLLSEARHGRIRWHPEAAGSNQYLTSPDLEVITPRVVAKHANEKVKVDVVYDRAGHVEQCVVVKKSKVDQLNSEACLIASRADIFGPVKDASGATTRGLRDIDLVFSHGDTEQIIVL